MDSILQIHKTIQRHTQIIGALARNPKHPVWVVQAYDLSTSETGGLGVQGHLQLYIKFKASLGHVRPYLKKPKPKTKVKTKNAKIIQFLLKYNYIIRALSKNFKTERGLTDHLVLPSHLTKKKKKKP